MEKAATVTSAAEEAALAAVAVPAEEAVSAVSAVDVSGVVAPAEAGNFQHLPC